MTPRQFRSRRRDLGHSQATLAKAIGYSKHHIGALERGDKPIRPMVELALDGLELRAMRARRERAADDGAHP